MTQSNAIANDNPRTNKALAIGLVAVFVTQFVSFLFINARNIAQPVILTDLDGLNSFALLIALPALTGSAGTLLFGKLSDMYGRRTILLVTNGIFMLGLLLSTISPTMPLLIASQTFMSIGHFPIIPLCVAVIGDFFTPIKRAQWTGYLNIATTAAALFGPVLGGFIAESVLGWRAIFWGTIPLVLIACVLIIVGVSKHTETSRQKIDFVGTALMLMATSTLIFGVTWLADPTRLFLGIGLLVLSLLAWVGFLRTENRAEAPILDPQVLYNRTFAIAAGTGFLSFFAIIAILAYSPVFVQTVMQIDPTLSGSMLTPYTVITALTGILAGILIARTKKYKWMYNISYIMVTIALFIMWRFTINTPIWIYVLITSIAGFGLGVIPTVNILVAQYAVPKRLLGAAVGAMFFFQTIAIAIAPALLGLAQNSAPDLEAGLKAVFLVSAIVMLIGTIIIFTIPEIDIDIEVADALAPDLITDL